MVDLNVFVEGEGDDAGGVEHDGIRPFVAVRKANGKIQRAGPEGVVCRHRECLCRCRSRSHANGGRERTQRQVVVVV